MVHSPLAAKIRALRAEFGLSSAELSRLAGYSSRYLSAIENGSLPATDAVRRRLDLLEAVGKTKSGHRLPHPIGAAAPLGLAVEDGSLILRESRRCACGCDVPFIPNAWNHRFLPGHWKRKDR